MSIWDLNSLALLNSTSKKNTEPERIYTETLFELMIKHDTDKQPKTDKSNLNRHRRKLKHNLKIGYDVKPLKVKAGESNKKNTKIQPSTPEEPKSIYTDTSIKSMLKHDTDEETKTELEDMNIKKYECDVCGNKYSSRHNLNRHKRKSKHNLKIEHDLKPSNVSTEESTKKIKI